MNEKFLNDLNNEKKVKNKTEDLLSAIERVEKILSQPINVNAKPAHLSDTDRQLLGTNQILMNGFKQLTEENKALSAELINSNNKVLQERIKGEKTKRLKYSAILGISVASILFLVWVLAFGSRSWTEYQRSETAEKEWFGNGYDKGRINGYNEAIQEIYNDAPVKTADWLKRWVDQKRAESKE